MADAVTTKIKQLLNQRDAQVISGTQYVQNLLEEVKKEILANLVTLPASGFASYQLRQTLSSIERYLSSFETSANRELGSGISQAWEMGAELLPAALQAAGGSGMYLGTVLPGNVLDTLKEFAFGRITNVTNELFNRIKAELTMGILGQRTPQEVAATLAGNLPGPSIFRTIAERAEVITGLEMGRAYSISTQQGIEGAAERLPQLKRMWLHAGHPRMPRQVHLLMHGQVRGVKNPFYQSTAGGAVMYPRDPQAPIKEVIRCGCTHVPFMESWGSAKSFAAAWDQSQYRVNHRQGAQS